MVQFTQLPAQQAPLGGSALYAVASDVSTDFDIRILRSDGSQLGAKRFLETAMASFDVAPYLRQNLHFLPSTGSTGLHEASARTVTARVVATDGKATSATSPDRQFLPSAEAVAAPALLTSMPLTRLIGQEESDELTLLADGPLTVTVTAQSDESTVAESYAVPSAGLWLFRFSAADFSGADRVVVDAGVCGAVVYLPVGRSSTSRRIAWRSRMGSIEHYTFSSVRDTQISSARQRVETADGPVITHARRIRQQVLTSAYEMPDMAETLAEVIVSPEVWAVEGDRYTPVEVITGKVGVQCLGELCTLEITMSNPAKIVEPWN